MWRTMIRTRGCLIAAGVLLLTACAGNPGAAPTAVLPAAATATPVSVGETPAESTATESVAPGSVATAIPAEEAVALPTVTATPEAEAPGTAADAAAPALPSFDPAQTTVAFQTVVEGLDQPLFLTHAGDGSGRMFVVEKPGRIRVVQDGQVAATPFLDLTDRVNSSAYEQGLLGLAFAPNYPETGYFFVNYTDLAGDTVISRFQVTPDHPDAADPTSEFLVLTFDQPAANHNGGMVLFGPDGYLWIGTGDGGGANDRFGNGQNPATYLGKMLRLDVTTDPTAPYLIPADNPWVANDWNGTDVWDEIWALGLRNPWRYSFDRATGDLWIADVGQNQYEEINFTPAGSPGGLNYGWPILEASACFQSSACDPTGLEMPVVEYSHQAGHCSVTGGYVYRGATFPALQGVYFYGDYCSGVVWATWPTAEGGWTTAEVLSSGATLSSFGEDEAGEVYATDLGRGLVYQLVAE